MAEVKLRFRGNSIIDAHTHYEVFAQDGPDSVRVVINGTIAQDFKQRENKNLHDCEKLIIIIQNEDISREGNLVDGVKIPFRSNKQKYLRISDANQIQIDNNV